MPLFLANYSEKILSRANSHPPPDPIAECLTPYLYLSYNGIYSLNQTDVNFKILNILNAIPRSASARTRPHAPSPTDVT